jgi:endonuclease-3 related protein
VETGAAGNRINRIYHLFLDEYGPQGWWPVTIKEGEPPRYCGGPRNDRQRFEVAAGAVLTQNTAWSNASRALMSLSSAGLLDPSALAAAPIGRVARLIHSSGYYNQKAERLALLARYFLEHESPDRKSLLELKGIGPETADSIMLYGFSEPFFVVDTYTRRIFGRLGILCGSESYEWIRDLFERSCAWDASLLGEYHALIVKHGKEKCRPRIDCGSCPAGESCYQKCR